MTRNEFNAHFAATMNTTEGFTQDELDEINDAVFNEVCELNWDDPDTDGYVQNMFAREFNRR